LKLAKVHHPDKSGDPEKFKEILRASEVLTDDKKRAMYDQFGVVDGEQGQSPNSGHGFPGMPPGFGFPFEVNLGDLFGNMFGGQVPGAAGNKVRKGKKPPPSLQTIPITLEQFYLGHNFDININRQCFCTGCDHSGAKSKEACKGCGGRGVVTQIVQMGPMAMHSTGPCIDCQGKGDKVIKTCDACSGSGFITEKRNLGIKVMPGTRNGETFIFPEVCSDHPGFERPGDAHIVLSEDTNDPSFTTFKRTGDKYQNLETRVSISLSESLIGCVVQIDGHPGYDDGLFLKIPAGSFQGDVYCVSGSGMPIAGNIGKYGDLFVHIDVAVRPAERSFFVTVSQDLLTTLFEDKIRKTECKEESIVKDLYLHV
jgi:DnaJ-class molecular chaperone